MKKLIAGILAGMLLAAGQARAGIGVDKIIVKAGELMTKHPSTAAIGIGIMATYGIGSSAISTNGALNTLFNSKTNTTMFGRTLGPAWKWVASPSGTTALEKFGVPANVVTVIDALSLNPTNGLPNIALKQDMLKTYLESLSIGGTNLDAQANALHAMLQRVK